jgi:uncharacterized protein YoaH (UPF0181 family)
MSTVDSTPSPTEARMPPTNRSQTLINIPSWPTNHSQQQETMNQILQNLMTGGASSDVPNQITQRLQQQTSTGYTVGPITTSSASNTNQGNSQNLFRRNDMSSQVPPASPNQTQIRAIIPRSRPNQVESNNLMPQHQYQQATYHIPQSSNQARSQNVRYQQAQVNPTKLVQRPRPSPTYSASDESSRPTSSRPLQEKIYNKKRTQNGSDFEAVIGTLTNNKKIILPPNVKVI